VSHGAPWHHPSFVEQQLATHGFKDAKVEVTTSLASVDSPAAYAGLFSPMLAGFLTMLWSNEDCEKYGKLVKPAVLKYMTETYGEVQGIEWEMAAVIATARKP
jgi:hypothetical protein